ncbi:MAG: glycosyltransferase, partial [Acidobacteriota bacterium]
MDRDTNSKDLTPYFPVRILLSLPWFFPEAGGGGQTYVLQVAKELQRRGHEVRVLAGVRGAGGGRPGTGDGRRERAEGAAGLGGAVSKPFLLSEYTFDGVRVLALRMNPRALRWEEAIAETSPALLAGLGAALDEAKPDLVHLNGFKPALTRLCSERGIPFVVTAHHPGVVCPAGLRLNEKGEICEEAARPEVCVRCCATQRSGSRLLGTALAALPAGLSRLAVRASGTRGPGGKAVRAVAYPEAVRESLLSKALVWEEAPLWIAPSQAMKGYLLRQGIEEGRVVHIPHGMEPVAGVPPVRIEGERVRFGYLGGFSFVKGLHVLTEAAGCMAHGERCEIHVFGRASSPWACAYRAQTVGRYAGKTRLVLHDPIPHERVAEAYAAFDVLVVPSNCLEVFGLVVLEAFTAGRPVIVSDAGALPELVRDGVDGLIVPHGDAGALAGAMDALAAEPERVLKIATQLPPVRSVAEHVDDLVQAYGMVRAPVPGLPSSSPVCRLPVP